jgi:hypothetical protein
LSWDAKHKEAYDQALKDENLIKQILQVPRRSRILRKGRKEKTVLVFGKKGEQSIFTLAGETTEPVVVGAEQAVPLLEATPEEVSYEVPDKFAPVFNKAKEKLFAKNPLPPIKGRRQDAIKMLMALKETIPSSESYCADLIKIIKEYDDVSEGTLKDIAQMDIRNVEQAYSQLQENVPVQFIRNVIDRAHRADEGRELLLLAEELDA